MKVILKTRLDSRNPEVEVVANELCRTVSDIDERIHALRVARNWLEKELEKGKTK